MKHVLGWVIVAASLAGNAHAEEATARATEAAAHQMVEDAFIYMGLAYICQDAIGTSYYHAARTMTEQVFRMGGKSDADAVLMADGFDKRIRADHKKKAPAANQEKCMDTLLTVQTQARVSRARFQKAVEAETINRK